MSASPLHLLRADGRRGSGGPPTGESPTSWQPLSHRDRHRGQSRRGVSPTDFRTDREAQDLRRLAEAIVRDPHGFVEKLAPAREMSREAVEEVVRWVRDASRWAKRTGA